jgi:hypothetical protein
MADRGCGLVSLYDAVERLAVDQVENLGENEAAGVHGRKFWKMPFPSSNPSHAFLCLIHSFQIISRNLNSNQPDTRDFDYLKGNSLEATFIASDAPKGSPNFIFWFNDSDLIGIDLLSSPSRFQK